MKDFIANILTEEHIKKQEIISQIFRISKKRLQMQYSHPTVKVLVENDYIAHIIGEMNGFLQCLKVFGVIKYSIIVSISGNSVTFKNSQTEEVLHEEPLGFSFSEEY